MGRSRGERAGLSRQQVLDAALALVDRDGPEQLSMRRLGAELGVEAMTLYHYVPTKDALLAGLVERVLTLVPVRAELPWQEALRAHAHALREVLLRHPRVLPLCLNRPVATEDSLRAVEQGLALLRAQGFPLGHALDLLNSLHLFVLAHTISEVGTAPINRTGAAGSTGWLAELDPAEFPLLTESARTGSGTNDAERFARTVDALLTGFAASCTVHN